MVLFRNVGKIRNLEPAQKLNLQQYDVLPGVYLAAVHWLCLLFEQRQCFLHEWTARIKKSLRRWTRLSSLTNEPTLCAIFKSIYRDDTTDYSQSYSKLRPRNEAALRRRQVVERCLLPKGCGIRSHLH